MGENVQGDGLRSTDGLLLLQNQGNHGRPADICVDSYEEEAHINHDGSVNGLIENIFMSRQKPKPVAVMMTYSNTGSCPE